ncbi:MAG: hypothetical protein ACI4NJ_00165 [Cellvibrio sp.]
MEDDYRIVIKQLVNQFNNGEITLEQYRDKRQKIINFMDEDFNGIKDYSSEEFNLNIIHQH